MILDPSVQSDFAEVRADNERLRFYLSVTRKLRL